MLFLEPHPSAIPSPKKTASCPYIRKTGIAPAGQSCRPWLRHFLGPKEPVQCAEVPVGRSRRSCLLRAASRAPTIIQTGGKLPNKLPRRFGPKVVEFWVKQRLAVWSLSFSDIIQENNRNSESYSKEKLSARVRTYYILY